MSFRRTCQNSVQWNVDDERTVKGHLGRGRARDRETERWEDGEKEREGDFCWRVCTAATAARSL